MLLGYDEMGDDAEGDCECWFERCVVFVLGIVNVLERAPRNNVVKSCRRVMSLAASS